MSASPLIMLLVTACICTPYRVDVFEGRVGLPTSLATITAKGGTLSVSMETDSGRPLPLFSYAMAIEIASG
ncbi:hypothetical protein BGZ63DRAFT_397311 [Mariannaea sp. PMI_226]|nr:hypothetical protein BGZ63DRAFT_397311 [Mariannaea sp. PMI_226]